ncbi:MAG: hypothetical protein L0207_01675 [Chlamydiae bacterium]|nr:hypothetical protein [Chlamydiota bacterium]
MRKLLLRNALNELRVQADALRVGIACLKRREVVFLLNKLIFDLENKCIRCCETGNFWTNCLSPIVSKLEKWRIFGIPSDPAWD